MQIVVLTNTHPVWVLASPPSDYEVSYKISPVFTTCVRVAYNDRRKNMPFEVKYVWVVRRWYLFLAYIFH